MSILLRRMIDRVALEVARLGKLRGDGIIKVSNTQAGPTLTLDINQLQARLPKGGGSSGVVEMIAAENAPSGNQIEARLASQPDVLDEFGNETPTLTVSCDIVGGTTNLSEALPKLELGTPFRAQWSINLTEPGYRATMTFQSYEACP